MLLVDKKNECRFQPLYIREWMQSNIKLTTWIAIACIIWERLETWEKKFIYANYVTKVCYKDGDRGDNVGAMFQWEIAMFPNVGMNLESKTIEEEILFSLTWS